MMSVMRSLPASFALFFIVVLALALQTTIARAQTPAPSELETTIRQLLLNDPRAASLPQSQFDEMVSALTAAAAAKGLTAAEVSWHPVPISNLTATAAAGTPTVCSQYALLCRFSSAFGFSGSDLTIPVSLGIASAILLILIWGMIRVSHRASSPVPAAPPAPAAPAPPPASSKKK